MTAVPRPRAAGEPLASVLAADAGLLSGHRSGALGGGSGVSST